MDFIFMSCTGKKEVISVQECCTPSWTRPSWSRGKISSETPRSAGSRLMSAEVHGQPSRIEVFSEDIEEDEGELMNSSRSLPSRNPLMGSPSTASPVRTSSSHLLPFQQNLWSAAAEAEPLPLIESESILLHQLQPSNPTTAEPTPRSVNYSRNHTPRQTREAAPLGRAEPTKSTKSSDMILIQ
eukprot:758485-Hanusia_phi.AAC.2